MKKSKLLFWAIVDSLGLLAYVSLVAFILFNGEKLFGKIDNFTGPVMMLLLFVISAVITASLFLGRPIYMHINGLKKEAVQLFFYTLASLVAILLIIFAVKVL